MVIAQLQSAIGRGLGAYANDRDPNRAESVEQALRPAFHLAIEAQAHDPPIEQSGPWSGTS